MKLFFLMFSAPLAILLFGLLCLMGTNLFLAAALAVLMYAGFLYSELRAFI